MPREIGSGLVFGPGKRCFVCKPIASICWRRFSVFQAQGRRQSTFWSQDHGPVENDLSRLRTDQVRGIGVDVDPEDHKGVVAVINAFQVAVDVLGNGESVGVQLGSGEFPDVQLVHIGHAAEGREVRSDVAGVHVVGDAAETIGVLGAIATDVVVNRFGDQDVIHAVHDDHGVLVELKIVRVQIEGVPGLPQHVLQRRDGVCA